MTQQQNQVRVHCRCRSRVVTFSDFIRTSKVETVSFLHHNRFMIVSNVIVCWFLLFLSLVWTEFWSLCAENCFELSYCCSLSMVTSMLVVLQSWCISSTEKLVLVLLAHERFLHFGTSVARKSFNYGISAS